MVKELTSKKPSKEEKSRRGVVRFGWTSIAGHCPYCGKKMVCGDKMYYDYKKGYICEKCAWGMKDD